MLKASLKPAHFSDLKKCWLLSWGQRQHTVSTTKWIINCSGKRRRPIRSWIPPGSPRALYKMDVRFWSTNIFAKLTKVKFNCKNMVAKINFMLWDANTGNYFTAYLKAVFLWYKTIRSNILVNQKWGNCQQYLSQEKWRKTLYFASACEPGGGSVIFLGLVLTCISSICQRTLEFFFSLFDLLPSTESLCTCFSCLGDKVTQLRNGILPRKGSASGKLMYLTPCWIFDYRLQMCSDTRPKFTDGSCPRCVLSYFPRADPQL